MTLPLHRDPPNFPENTHNSVQNFRRPMGRSDSTAETTELFIEEQRQHSNFSPPPVHTGPE